MVSIIIKGMMNLNQAFMLTFTMASDGNIKPVGVRKPIMPMPNKYAFTISRPGTPTSIASEPIIGIVSTAIPDDDEMKNVKPINNNIITTIKSDGGIPLTACAA